MPIQVTYDLPGGLQLGYVRPAIQNEDYAFMPEAVIEQRSLAFFNELNEALDAVDEQQPPAWLPGILLIAAAFWTGVWLIWRGLL